MTATNPGIRTLRHNASDRPFIVTWEVTRACDLVCQHCRADAIRERNPFELTTTEGCRLLDELASFGAPRPFVVLTGGDPFHWSDLEALVVFPASLLRPLGGYLADRFGARRVMYLVFTTMTFACLLLAAPEGHVVVELPGRGEDAIARILPWSMNIWLFTVLIVLIGVAMGVGKAAVFVYIPVYFPADVGAVGGLVGAVGGLGGFLLPLLFSWTEGLTGIPQATFMVLLLLIVISFAWLHLTVYRMLQRESPHLEDRFEHPEKVPT